MQSFGLFFFIGLIFSPLAAFIAFIITYEEYTHHFIDKKKAFEHGLQMAFITFVVFIIVSLLAGFLFQHGFAQ